MKETYAYDYVKKKKKNFKKTTRCVIPIMYIEFYQRQNCRKSKKISGCKELRERECHKQVNHGGYLGQ